MIHLSYKNRIQLQALKELGRSQSKIAREIGFSPGCISQELKYWKINKTPYDAEQAQYMTTAKRREANQLIHTKVVGDSIYKAYIDENFTKYRSPEQISHRMKEQSLGMIATQTVYDYIYRTYDKEKRKKYMRRKGKKYKRGSREKKIKIRDRVSIEERPIEVEDRARLGDIENDTIVGLDKKDRIVTQVDRKSRFLIAGLALSKSYIKMAVDIAMTMVEGLREKAGHITIHTSTFDNGVEFADHMYIQEMIGAKTYFCNPYHSRERGTNEYKNSSLRQFFPKKYDFKQITKESLAFYVDLINNRPMKCLGRKTPTEVFYANHSNV